METVKPNGLQALLICTTSGSFDLPTLHPRPHLLQASFILKSIIPRNTGGDGGIWVGRSYDENARTPCKTSNEQLESNHLTETTGRLRKQRLLVHLLDHGRALLVPNLKIEVEGERPTDQVGGEFVGVWP
jgi:hypothetical protein